MVKKLMKYEFIYYIRTLSIFLPWILIMGLLVRILTEFDNGTKTMSIAMTSAYTLFTLSVTALNFYCMAIGIVRFYKNMYSNEGYLTFTLPVTSKQHIWVKLFAYIIVLLVCSLISSTAQIIATSGQTIEELVLMFNTLRELLIDVPTIHVVWYIIEASVISLLVMVYTPMLAYACISIGQRSKKNRILLAVGAYFGYNIIMMILGTILIIFISAFVETDAFYNFLNMFDLYSFFHFLLACIAVVIAVLLVACYHITKHMMDKKLNLE